MPTIGCVGLGVQRNGIKSHNKMQTFKIPHFKVKKKRFNVTNELDYNEDCKCVCVCAYVCTCACAGVSSVIVITNLWINVVTRITSVVTLGLPQQMSKGVAVDRPSCTLISHMPNPSFSAVTATHSILSFPPLQPQSSCFLIYCIIPQQTVTNILHYLYSTYFHLQEMWGIVLSCSLIGTHKRKKYDIIPMSFEQRNDYA